MISDEKYMQRCLELASLGKGNTAPNPMVGSVIVHKDRIIGEGYHKKCGLSHAEVNAINSVKNEALLPYSTIYVNLEPCSHQGRTPACSKLIIEKKIPKVVIGCTDSFEKVSGNGIKMLKNADCQVKVGILENQSRRLNKRFFTFHEKKRPYIILKWAETLDGYIDKIRTPETPIEPNWITDTDTKMLVHKWRSEEAGIMVGKKTAQKDNPSLNVRDWTGKNPTRIVIDSNLELDKNLNLFDNKINTLIFNTLKNVKTDNTEYIKIKKDDYFLNSIMKELHKRDILSIFVEGGAFLHNSLIKKGLWDEARVFIGNKMFYEGVQAPKIKTAFSEITDIGRDKLVIFKNTGTI